MADPTINLSTPIVPLSTIVKVTTAATNENILANKASSGKLIRIVFLAVNSTDASNATTATASVYDQDGTGMNSNTGRNEVAIGADVVAGSSIGVLVPTGMDVSAAGGQVILTRDTPYYLHEDESLVINNGAANDADWTITYEVLG